MFAPVAIFVSIALAAGVGMSGAPAPRSTALLNSSRDAAAANRTLSSFVATFAGETSTINWTQSVAGTDGIGAGNDKFRVAVLVDDVDVCHIDVACDATAPADYVATCTPSQFSAGQDIDVRITSMPCSAAPTGFHTTDLTRF
jgi:hypothetical protein